tara:strand:+ start:373 stop:609 length:237 start_codon:yes stop_codon:yes gene_type:complete
MDNSKIRAEDAKRLRNDDTFKLLLQEVRENQKEVFATTAADEIERREEAHAILRAMSEMITHLDAVITAETLLEMRKG